MNKKIDKKKPIKKQIFAYKPTKMFSTKRALDDVASGALLDEVPAERAVLGPAVAALEALQEVGGLLARLARVRGAHAVGAEGGAAEGRGEAVEGRLVDAHGVAAGRIGAPAHSGVSLQAAVREAFVVLLHELGAQSGHVLAGGPAGALRLRALELLHLVVPQRHQDLLSQALPAVQVPAPVPELPAGLRFFQADQACLRSPYFPLSLPLPAIGRQCHQVVVIVVAAVLHH